MTTELTTTDRGALAPACDLPLDQRPALVYLAGLAPGSRRAMRQALETIAHELDKLEAETPSVGGHA